MKELKRKKGSQYCFWFRNDEPLITIGPHCKLIFLNRRAFSFIFNNSFDFWNLLYRILIL